MAPSQSSETSELNVSVSTTETPVWLRFLGTEPEPGPRYVPKLATPREQAVLFTVLAVLLILLMGFVAALSSEYLAPGSTSTGAAGVLMALAFLVGTLGGVVHSLASLSHYAAKGTLYTNWRLFYLSRPLIGGTVAVFLYFLLGSSLVGNVSSNGAQDATSPETRLFATLAWSALAGLFAFRVLEKFRDLLNALLPTIQPTSVPKPDSEETGTEVPPSPDSGEAAETVPPGEGEAGKKPGSAG